MDNMSPELPDGFDLFEGEGSIELVHRPRRGEGLVRLIFSFFWCGFLFVFTWVAISIGSGNGGYGMALVTIPFWGVGLFVFYQGLTGLVNRTRTVVGGGEVQILPGPLPFPGKRTFARGEVQQLYVTKTKAARGAKSRFDLQLVTGSGHRQMLVSGFRREEHARFIEARLETLLGMADERVAGASATSGEQAGLQSGTSLPDRDRTGDSEAFASFRAETGFATAALPVPPRFNVSESSAGLTIESRRPPAMGAALGVFAMTWCSVLAWITWSSPLFFKLFSFPFWLIGAVLSYVALAFLINRRRITASSQSIRVASGPLWWYDNTEFARGDVEQLFVKKEKHKSKSGTYYSYAVHVQLRDERTLEFASGFDSHEDARFIESRIEAFLGIEDRPVTT